MKLLVGAWIVYKLLDRWTRDWEPPQAPERYVNLLTADTTEHIGSWYG